MPSFICRLILCLNWGLENLSNGLLGFLGVRIYGQENDTNLVFEPYELTDEKNTEFGIFYMNAENYTETKSAYN